MSNRITRAVSRLSEILPLQLRQSQLDSKLSNLHQQLLKSFVYQGRVLNRVEIAELVDNADVAIQALAASKLLVLSTDCEVVGVYPFTMEQRDHQIRINHHLVHAMCALDALAAAPMFTMPAEIDSRCCISGEPVRIIQQADGEIESTSRKDIYFAIDWGAFHATASCAASLCLQMNYINSAQAARQWCNEDSERRELFSLPEAVAFASQFFLPLMHNRESFPAPG